ncbi:hypothetical protein Angca_000295, partial [Angiostrongylus cantonensis]
LKDLFAGCPKEYIHMMFYIDGLQYYDKPNYAVLRGLLRDALESNKLSEFPYDWEPKNNEPIRGLYQTIANVKISLEDAKKKNRISDE